MKGIAAILVFLLGAAMLLCVGVLLSPALLGLGALGSEEATVVASGGVLLLLVIGIFAGYFYGVPVQKRQADQSMLERFGKALDFERRQRNRLESELVKARQTLVTLEDELARITAASRMADPIAPSEDEDGDNVHEAYEKLRADYEQLRENLTRRKERIVDLQTELSIAQAETERVRQVASDGGGSAGASSMADGLLDGPSVRDILERIVSLEGVHVALVADDFGLVIDSAGDSLPAESIAAISSLIAHLGPRVRDVLPMGQVTSVTLVDDNGLVLETRYFELFGTKCAVAVARDHSSPFTGLTQEAADAIIDRMK